ncbi:MAG: alpha/beta hydrolase [Bacteroidales bacterium]|nr:alpha/beta hydrolase [Bacteroidales bacterium]
MKRIVLLAFFTLLVSVLRAQETVPQTYKFAVRDTASLYLDYYRAAHPNGMGYTVIYIFGGGFYHGERNGEMGVQYARLLNERGYDVACIDYRLGLRGANMKGLHVIKSLENAISMAVEDLFAATAYLVEHAAELGIDPAKFIVCGSSAGAVTALQADYELGNAMERSRILPEGFRYAGILSFAGAIFSRNGAVKYTVQSPAPTFFNHGTEDHLVTYKSIRFGNLGFFGANALIKRFEKAGYPYFARRYEGLGHEPSALMVHCIDITEWFIQQYVVQKRPLRIDETVRDPQVKPWSWGKTRATILYNKRLKK